MHKEIPKIALRNGVHTHFINECDIIYLKAEGSYTSLHLVNETVITLSKKIKSVEERLSSAHFFRIHHSYVINLLHVIYYKNNGENYLVLSNNEQLSLARDRKADFFQLFRKL